MGEGQEKRIKPGVARDENTCGYGKPPGKFYKAIHMKKKYSASFENLVQFRAQQAIFPLLKNYQPCDYAYFEQRGWFDKKRRYYVEAKINPIEELKAKVIAGFVYRNVCRAGDDLQRRKKADYRMTNKKKRVLKISARK